MANKDTSLSATISLDRQLAHNQVANKDQPWHCNHSRLGHQPQWMLSPQPSGKQRCLPTKTMLTDQEKGSIAAIHVILGQAAQFSFLFHCHQNIIKKCCGGKGTTTLMALWMFNLLCSANLVTQLDQYKAKYYCSLHPSDRHYLQKVVSVSCSQMCHRGIPFVCIKAGFVQS